jgi:hypothetical protein
MKSFKKITTANTWKLKNLGECKAIASCRDTCYRITLTRYCHATGCSRFSYATPVLLPWNVLYPYSWLRSWNIVIQLFTHFPNISLVFFHFWTPLFSRVSLITRVFSTSPLTAKICTKLRKGKDCLHSESP